MWTSVGCVGQWYLSAPNIIWCTTCTHGLYSSGPVHIWERKKRKNKTPSKTLRRTFEHMVLRWPSRVVFKGKNDDLLESYHHAEMWPWAGWPGWSHWGTRAPHTGLRNSQGCPCQVCDPECHLPCHVCPSRFKAPKAHDLACSYLHRACCLSHMPQLKSVLRPGFPETSSGILSIADTQQNEWVPWKTQQMLQLSFKRTEVALVCS